MGSETRPARRLALFLVVAFLTLLAAQGLVALCTGRVLLTLPGVDGPSGVGSTTAEQRLAAARSPGLYRAHPDPLVGYVLRANAELTILGGDIHSDALGLRRRTGPPPPPHANALRIVILGDSVAFGFGLDDDETLAARLEEMLRASMGPRARPVVCRTVAMPGWNHRNAVHFLLDHLEQLDPDIVVYLPVGNDLEDTDGILESGHRRQLVPDPTSTDPWLFVGPGIDPLAQFAETIRDLPDADVESLAKRAGPPALRADVSPESSGRYDDNARSVSLLSARMARRGTRVLVANFSEGLYVWHLWRRLIELGLDAPVLPLFTSLPTALRLPGDPHPNAEATFAMAIWVAEELQRLEWLPRGVGGPLPEVPGSCSPHRAARRSAKDVLRISDSQRRSARAALRSAVDTTTIEGVRQLYSPLNRDGSVGTRLLAALARAGDRLEIVLEPLAARPDLYPLSVSVEADGEPLGTVVIPTDAVARETLSLPPRVTEADVVEVRLVPQRWIVTSGEGGPTLASFRPVRIATLP
ncbi:MAG: SGNH/GDSL hydrolase family protein [Planctomycetota bacterium]|jgi:hypothetical protein